MPPGRNGRYRLAAAFRSRPAAPEEDHRRHGQNEREKSGKEMPLRRRPSFRQGSPEVIPLAGRKKVFPLSGIDVHLPDGSLEPVYPLRGTVSRGEGKKRD